MRDGDIERTLFIVVSGHVRVVKRGICVVELGPTTQRLQLKKRLVAAGGGPVLASEEPGVHPVTQLQAMTAELVMVGKKVDPAGLFPKGPDRIDGSDDDITNWADRDGPISDR